LTIKPAQACDPERDLISYVLSVFDHCHANADFVRLLMDQNIERGAHITLVSRDEGARRGLIKALQALVDRGAMAGVWRAGIDVVDLQMSIVSLCVFTLTNRYTMEAVFALDLSSPAALAARRDHVADMVARSLRV
jgi:hypothetical protein